LTLWTGTLGTDHDPADEQLLRTDIGQVVYPTGAALVVTVAGEIDLSTREQFRAALTAGFNQLRHGQILVIDLTNVTFISSTGLQALVDIAQAMQQRPEPLRLVVDHTRPVVHPLKITGLHEFLALFNTVNDALQTPR
jgi:anti-sigma B factor antagonist